MLVSRIRHLLGSCRRLRRICAALGNRRIQFISCSATIANPIEHMSSIFGIDNIALVEEDGSPTGRKVSKSSKIFNHNPAKKIHREFQEYLIWNPPFIDPQDMKQGRVSTLVEASRLFRHFLSRGIRTIVFCKVRIVSCRSLSLPIRRVC
jgi:DEAD/DEAH box helicase domain-containing protein